MSKSCVKSNQSQRNSGRSEVAPASADMCPQSLPNLPLCVLLNTRVIHARAIQIVRTQCLKGILKNKRPIVD